MDASTLKPTDKVRVVRVNPGWNTGALMPVGTVCNLHETVLGRLDAKDPTGTDRTFAIGKDGEWMHDFELVQPEDPALTHLKARYQLLAEQATSEFGLGRKAELEDLFRDYYHLDASAVAREETIMVPQQKRVVSVEFTPCK